jgi:hypothetical protein
MSRIVTNKLLNPTKRYISNRKNTFITSDGPNDTGMKIGLDDFGIPYDSHYRSRIVLPAGTTDYFLNYGTLENVTFLLIKVTYNGNYDYANEDNYDPYYYYEPNTYNINYYYEGNSGVTYPIGRLLLLNGSFTNKLTRIYLNNPLDYDVVLDVLHANIADPKPIPPSSAITISNLYYNDIITNQVPCGFELTGSTEFIINKFVFAPPSGYTIPYIVPYNTIISIQKDIAVNSIYLSTLTITYILKFLTEFDCNQAYSRMMFAYTSYFDDSCRYLTVDNVYNNGSEISCSSGYTGVNVNPPIIYYNSPIIGTSWIGSGTTVPSNVILNFVHDGISGWTLDSLKNLFISGIIDCFDGNVALSSITFLLYNAGSIVPLSGISQFGTYDILISVTNSAGNTITNYITNIISDDSPPVIVYRPYVLVHLTGNTTTYSGASSAITSGIYIESGFTVNINGFDGNYIDRLGIIDNIVEYVYDVIDLDINKYMINVLIVGWSHINPGSNIVYSAVTQYDSYCVKLSISDSRGNETINYLIMKVIFDVSVYSEGYWLDNKVWIDNVLWMDHPF